MFNDLGNILKVHDCAEAIKYGRFKWMYFKVDLFCKSQGHVISLSSLVRPEPWMSLSPERTRIICLLELRAVKMGFKRTFLFTMLKSTKLTTNFTLI